MSHAPEMDTNTTDRSENPAATCVGSGALLGGLEILALDQSAECVGCGNEKRHRSKPAESMVCCGDCWRRMPQWAKDGFANDTRRPEAGPEHGATIWQNRLSILLQWMRDADSPNTQPSSGPKSYGN